MKLYFAGSFSGATTGLQENVSDFLRSLGVRNKLYSFYNEKSSSLQWGGKGLMLDSGAFTAWTKGVSIDIDSLIDFSKKLKPDHLIQLDVIGDDDETWNNFLYMKDRVQCLPVVHYKSSQKHIERCFSCDEIVCLGGLVPLARRPAELKKWLDYIFSMKFVHGKRTHCLGIMTKWVLERYPFYSSDSSSAASIVRYPNKCKFVTMSLKEKDYRHCFSLSIKKQLALEKYITALWARRGIVWPEVSA